MRIFEWKTNIRLRKQYAASRLDAEWSKSLTLSLISISAALYAVAISVTSPIPTPWGIGHFRPGVIIPAFFSIVFGPFVGGVGAAIGTFIGDFALSFFGYTTPLLSLIAGVPGNFVGFYLMGWLAKKWRSLSSFIVTNIISLFFGNLVAALGVLLYFWFIVPDWASWSISLKISFTMGLTLFWVVTMIVFVVPLVPLLVVFIEPKLEKMGIRNVSNISWDSPKNLLKSSFLVAFILLSLYLVTYFIPEGELLFGGVVPPELILLSSIVVFVCGLVFIFVINTGKFLFLKNT
jgi:uncharacterized membrane protein